MTDDQKWIGYVTVFTDASFHQETGAAGWAAWIKHQGSTRRRSGHFKNQPDNAGEAELAACGIGILSALNLFGQAKTIHIVSDSMHAIDKLTGGQINTPFVEKVVLTVKKRLRERNVRLKTAHVKAHQRPAKSRDWVNKWCDEEARKRMREQEEGTAGMAWPKALKIASVGKGKYRVRIGGTLIGQVTKTDKTFTFKPEDSMQPMLSTMSTGRMTEIREYIAKTIDRDTYMGILENPQGMEIADG